MQSVLNQAENDTLPPWWLWPLRVVTILISIFFLSPHTFYRPFLTGRDPNWEIALQYAFTQGWRFGSDIVFTYGPLGFLYSRLAYPGIAGYLLCWDTLTLGLVLLCLWVICRSLTTFLSHGAVLIAAFCLGAARPPIDPTVLYCFFTLFFLVLSTQHNSLTFLLLACLSTTIALYLKVGSGIVALIALLAFSIFHAISSPYRARYLLGISVGLGIIIGTGLLLPVDIVPYLRYSLEFISGYGEAMHKADPNNKHYLTIALVILSLFLFGVLASSPQWLQSQAKAAMVCSAGLFIFFLFKQGFVRADSHIYTFTSFAPLSLALIYLGQESSWRKKFSLFTAATLLGCFAAHHRAFQYTYFPQKYSQIRQYFSDSRVILANTTVPPETAPSAPLPQELLDQIGNESVDIISFQVYQLLRSNLNYRPRPVLHSYAAYTPVLDALNASFYESDKAPSFVLLSRVRLDDRYPFFDESLTRLALRKWYSPVLMRGGFILLKRNKEAQPIALRPTDAGVVALNERLVIPESVEPLYLKIESSYTLLGRLIRLLYKPPPLYLEFHLADGRSMRVRAIAPQLRAPVLINRVTLSLEHEVLFYLRREGELPLVREISLHSSWPWGMKPSFSYQWFKLSEEKIELAPEN